MSTLPDYEAFARAYIAGEAEVAVTTLVADLETPVSAYLKLARGRAANMFLLESVEGGAQRGRYSMIGLDPDLIFRSSGDRAEINRRALIDPNAFVPCPGDPLDALRALLAESRIAMPPGLPPMSAGIFGYLGYDMVRRMERLAPAKPDPIGVPEALLIRPTVMVVFDGARDEMSVVTPVRPASGVSARAAYESAMARLDAVVDALESPLDHTATMAVDPLVQAGEARSNTTEAEYKAMVARAKDYIAAGDAFQIVLSQRFTSRFDLPAFALYRALRRVNPSPLSLLPRLRRLPDRLLQSRNPGARAATARSLSARSPAPVREEKAQRKMRRWRPSYWPIRRSAPNISCCSTSAAMMSAASPKSAR